MKRIILAVSAVFGLAWMAWAGSITNFPITTTSAPVLPSRSFPNISSAYNGNGASIRGIAVAQVSNAAAKDGSNFTLASQAVGDLPYATSTTALGRIADVAAGSPLISGGVGVVPAYATYLLSGTAAATYTFPTSAKTLAANDGSNFTIASQAVGDLPYATSTTAYGRLGAGAVGAFLMSNGAAAAPSYLTAGAANYLLVGAGVTTIPVWTAPTGTGSPVLGTSPTITTPSITTYEVDGHATVGLTAAQVSSTIVYNTGMGAADVYLTLPTAAAGYSAIFTVGTAQANKWGVRAGTNDKIYLIASDGTVAAGSDNGYARMTAAQVGQSFACWTFKTDAYDWLCKAVSIGTSTFVPN